MQTVHRALRVLEGVAVSRQGIGVRALSGRLQLPPASVSRLLSALEEYGLVIQDGTTQQFHLGPRLVWLSTQYMHGSPLHAAAAPVVAEMRDQCNETVSVWVRDHDARVCVACLESAQIVRRVLTVGERVPIVSGVAGKVLLAFMGADELRRLWRSIASMLSGSGLSPADLQEELTRIRDQGYAVSAGERIVDARAVAAPVLDEEQGVIAALAISVPLSRFGPDRREGLLRLVVNGARRISQTMAHETVVDSRRHRLTG